MIRPTVDAGRIGFGWKYGNGNTISAQERPTAVALAVGIGSGSYYIASKNAAEAVDGTLRAILEDRRDTNKQYLDSIEQDLQILAAADQTVDAVGLLDYVFEGLGENPTPAACSRLESKARPSTKRSRVSAPPPRLTATATA